MTAAPPPTRGRRPLHRSLALAVALTIAGGMAAITLAGCSGSESENVSPASAPKAGNAAGGAPAQGPVGSTLSAERGAADSAAGSAGSGGQAVKPAAGTPSAVVKARLIRTAQVTMEVSGQLNVAVAQVKLVAKQFGGHVDSETTGLADTAEQKSTGEKEEKDGTVRLAQAGESLIVLRVPEPKLDDAITAVTGTPGGKVLSRTSSTQDVTSDIADLTSRIASQRASLDRVRALMSRATSLQDIVTLEAELSRRQADLESLESRLATLSDRADLSTLTVLLRTPTAKPKPQEPETGFLAGLKSGWRALQASTSVVLTVLGAILPITVVAVLIGWPAVRLARRRAQRRAAARPAASWPYGGVPGQPVPGQPVPGQPSSGPVSPTTPPQPVPAESGEGN
jgi:hypothetical protein